MANSWFRDWSRAKTQPVFRIPWQFPVSSHVDTGGLYPTVECKACEPVKRDDPCPAISVEFSWLVDNFAGHPGHEANVAHWRRGDWSPSLCGNLRPPQAASVANTRATKVKSRYKLMIYRYNRTRSRARQVTNCVQRTSRLVWMGTQW